MQMPPDLESRSGRSDSDRLVAAALAQHQTRSRQHSLPVRMQDRPVDPRA